MRAGYRSLAELVKHVVRVDTSEAKRWVAQASALFPSVTPTGAVVDAPLPLVADAVAEGVLSPAHLDVLVGAMASLPAEAEQILVDVALSAEPAGVRAVAAGFGRGLIRTVLNPPTASPFRRRTCCICGPRPMGGWSSAAGSVLSRVSCSGR
ncbi:MAG: DUF222 domain-containing protein [Umezawaea sp.]